MKAFALKFVIFLAALLTLQIMASALYPPALPEEILELEQRLVNGVDLVYLGDSTLTYPLGEVTTAEILQEQLPGHTVSEVAHPAYNLDLYQHYVEYITRHEGSIEAVVIPINMRSFSPEWDLRPNYQFEREKMVLTYGPLLSRILYRPLGTLGGFDSPRSYDAFLNTTVYNGEEPVGRVADFEQLIGNNDAVAQNADLEFAYYANLLSEEEKEALKGLLTYYYMYSLEPEHRKLQSMRQIARLLKINDIEPIFYITPINYELGVRHLGEAFRQRVTANVAQVERVLRQENVQVLNLIFDLEAYNFVDTEHLTENGKTYVADRLAAVINPLFPPRSTGINVKDGAPRRAVAVEAAPGVAPEVSIEPLATPSRTAVPNPGRRLATEVSIEPLATPLPEAKPITSSTPVRAEVQPESPALEQTSEPAATSDAAANPTATPEPTPTNTRVVLPGGLPSSSEPGGIVAAEFLGAFQPAGNYDVDLYRLHYQTFDRDDRPTVVRANIYIPRATGSEPLPILVYGGGTTGLSAACAPLDELARGGNWGSYHYQMLAYSAQGFITLWPEWQGYDQTGQTHPFFLAEPQARTMLDSARAVYRFFDGPQAAELPVAPQDAVFLGGYSSGGHAAFAAKDLAGRYAPELSIRGVFGHGPTTDPETLLIESPIFSPYLVYAYSKALGPDVVDRGRIFQDRWLASFEADATTRCVDNIFAYYSSSSRQMYRPEFREALAAGGLQSIAPAFKRALEANSAGLSPHGTDIPILILQGTADTVVTPGSQQAFAAGLCQVGHSVTYNSYPAVSHADTRHVSFRDTIAWLHGVADGDLPESNCDSLVSP